MIALFAAVLTFSVATAGAGVGENSSLLNVPPAEVDLGGQNNDCSATIPGRLPSSATHDFRIQNPQDGQTYTTPDGAMISLAVSSDDKHLNFAISGGAVVFDVIIKGGQKSLHFDYDGNDGPGGALGDEGLHAPTKGNGSNLYSISHVSFCYEYASPVSGFVYVDADQSGTHNNGEGADAPRVITAYSGTTAVATTTSGTDGNYTIYLQNGGPYTICEEDIPDFVQTAPDNLDCVGASANGSEDGGHTIISLNGAVGGLDFGNVPQICGQNLSVDGIVFDGVFELFEDGNDEVGCDDKIGQLSETDLGGNSYRLDLPLVGTGQVAGIGVIIKHFNSPDDFEPLTYSKVVSGPFAVLQWCGLRDKMGVDGDQFDEYLNPDSNTPYVFYPDMPANEVSCKVFVDENSEGVQTTVVLIEDDPFWQ